MTVDRDHNRPGRWPRLPGTDMLVPSGVPPVRIYRTERSVTRSVAGRPRWILEFERSEPSFIEPLMGWTGSGDPLAPIRLEFPDRESAVDFAEKNGWDYRVTDPPSRRMPIKSYTDRLKYELADTIVQARKLDGRDESLARQLGLSAAAGGDLSRILPASNRTGPAGNEIPHRKRR